MCNELIDFSQLDSTLPPPQQAEGVACCTGVAQMELATRAGVLVQFGIGRQLPLAMWPIGGQLLSPGQTRLDSNDPAHCGIPPVCLFIANEHNIVNGDAQMWFLPFMALREIEQIL